jgi:hypothetical protein
MSELSETGREILERAVAAAQKLYTRRYSDAKVIFLAGSIVRGEGTSTSDLDLIIVYEKLETARRESYYYEGFPVECFIHDPETLNYYYDLTSPAGYIPMVQMVLEGIEIPAPSDFSRDIKQLAQGYYERKPPALNAEEAARWRYTITNLIDDLREPRSKFELTATATELYKTLADFYLRTHDKWLAKGKTIPRVIAASDAELQAHFCAAFEDLFVNGKSESVITLTEYILAPHGGLLFDGFKSTAPVEARKELDK